ncbi:NYN domain, MARF1-type [Dillenia turbinata]|uniref:NYN domain, MARF1-type n=1 Tax=Dillenia turbinata TaxID=194707 RepID=A0AAN8UW70_9MAGN
MTGFINNRNNNLTLQHSLDEASFAENSLSLLISRNVRVYVWWDFENCSLPTGTNVFKVSQSITAAIRANGIKGPIQITAFGDVLQLSRASQEALSATGIILSLIFPMMNVFCDMNC